MLCLKCIESVSTPGLLPCPAYNGDSRVPKRKKEFVHCNEMM
uniref:Uncharacterized protein n=1 Tax=Rhizophora mucronata TaxID=61149 RepID=A0A2P2QCA1_RHIMU